MKFNKKIAMLALASTVCVAAGALSVNASIASAADENASAGFYMAVGAQVNKTNYEYGGIRWTTTIEVGYEPEQDVEAYTFGTLIMPTTVYDAVSDGNYAGVADAINLTYKEVTTTTLTEDLVFYSAISYDDLVQDGATEAQIKAAYALELTAISYAKSGENYYYATAEDTSRSARQVANAAMLAGELDDLDDNVQEELDQKNKIKNYVQGTRNVADYSEDYIDLTELKAGTAQAITSDTFASINWENVEEVVVGAKNIGTQYTQSGSTVSLKAVPSNTQTHENGDYAWVSVFMKDNAGVYSVPAIAADGVISSRDDVLNKLGNASLEVGGATVDQTQTGYYVLTNDIEIAGASTYLDNRRNSEKGGLQNAIFDGQGFTIYNVAAYYGVFGNVANSTIRNVGIQGKMQTTNKAASLVAGIIKNSILENVYVKVTAWNETGFGNAVAATMTDNTLRNCVIDSSAPVPEKWANPANLTTYYGVPTASISRNVTYSAAPTNTFVNSYVISGLPLFAYQSGTTSVETTDGTTFKYQTRYDIVDTLSKEEITEIQNVDGQTVTIGDKTVGPISDTNENGLTKSIYYTGTSYGNRNYFFRYKNYKQISGVTRYNKADDMKTAYTESNGTLFDGYDLDKYWSVTDNVLTWKNAK